MSATSASTASSYVASRAASYAAGVTLAEELERIVEHAGADAVLAAEPHPGERVYVCAFDEGDGGRSWLAFDRDGEPIRDRQRVRDAVSILALCELAEETAAESPAGIEEAEEAVLALQHAIGAPPTLATPARLDEIGAATRTLEAALGGAMQGSPFAAAMKSAGEVVEALFTDVAGSYRIPLR